MYWNLNIPVSCCTERQLKINIQRIHKSLKHLIDYYRWGSSTIPKLIIDHIYWEPVLELIKKRSNNRLRKYYVLLLVSNRWIRYLVVKNYDQRFRLKAILFQLFCIFRKVIHSGCINKSHTVSKKKRVVLIPNQNHKLQNYFY